MTMLLSAFEAFSDHATRTAGECCGLIVGEDYHPCRNLRQDGEHFELHPEDWDRAEELGPVRAVCHSHPGAPARASEADLAGCRETGVPWYILGADGLNRLDPAPIPLEGRPFVYGWSDCYSLVRDYYGDLPDFPREPEFWQHGHSPYTEHFRQAGFHQVDPADAQPQDLLLIRIRSWSIPNHAAVYLGSGQILHHLWGRLSRADLWGPFMASTTHCLRRGPC